MTYAPHVAILQNVDKTEWLPADFLRHVFVNLDGCWAWTGPYGGKSPIYKQGTASTSARRFAFMQRYRTCAGRLKPNLFCKCPSSCVNPEHMTYEKKEHLAYFVRHVRDVVTPAVRPPDATAALVASVGRLSREELHLFILLTQPSVSPGIVSVAKDILALHAFHAQEQNTDHTK